MEKMLASSKLNMEETANGIKDRRYTIEDRIRLSGMSNGHDTRPPRSLSLALNSHTLSTT
jgi:hypothetical protein